MVFSSVSGVLKLSIDFYFLKRKNQKNHFKFRRRKKANYKLVIYVIYTYIIIWHKRS